MTWSLDTKVICEPTKRTPPRAVMGWVGGLAPTSLYTTSLAIAEIRAGIDRMTDVPRRTELAHWLGFAVRPLFGPRVIDSDEAVHGAMLGILARLKTENRTLPITDLLFAAAARHHGLTVVTRNTRHFAGTGVPVLNPWEPNPVVLVD